MTKRKSMFQSEAAKKLYESTVQAFELDEHHLAGLSLAADCLDRIQTAKDALRKDGDFVLDRYGQKKEHPAARTLRENKVVFSRLIRELKLDDNTTTQEL